MPSPLARLDALLADLLSGWNIYTTILFILLAGFIAYPILTWTDADIHPFALARQANASLVRQPGESAIYRSNEVPHGFPLRAGLGVKEAGAAKWSAGRDGDLRDIWRAALGLVQKEKKDEKVALGKILTVYGREEVVEHKHADITMEINIIGKHFHEAGNSARVAIYLPNSIEYLTTVFASAFHGFVPVLLPFNLPHDQILELLQKTQATALVAAAGSVPLGDLRKSVPAVKKVVWVVERSSRHMDWSEVPEGVGGSIDVTVWHQLVQDGQGAANAELPEGDEGTKPGNLVTVWTDRMGVQEVVEFSQTNIVSGIGALLSALPPKQRLTTSDLVLPADTFSHSYTLATTLAALFSRSSVALNSVAGPTVNIAMTTRQISPTVIIASAESVAALHQGTAISWQSPLAKLVHYLHSRVLTMEGRMPAQRGLVAALHAPKRDALGTTPGQLRLLLVTDRAGSGLSPLPSAKLSDMRIFTGARVVYALTAAKVFGGVAQTNLFDYRRQETVTGAGHFGVPLASLEVMLKDGMDVEIKEGGRPRGELTVRGPSVQGGSARLKVLGTIRGDNTLAIV